MEYNMKKNISTRAKFIKACIRAMASNHLFGSQVQKGELQRRIVEPEWKCPDGSDSERYYTANMLKLY